jgi:hypothetical protein
VTVAAGRVGADVGIDSTVGVGLVGQVAVGARVGLAVAPGVGVGGANCTHSAISSPAAPSLPTIETRAPIGGSPPSRPVGTETSLPSTTQTLPSRA